MKKENIVQLTFDEPQSRATFQVLSIRPVVNMIYREPSVFGEQA